MIVGGPIRPDAGPGLRDIDVLVIGTADPDELDAVAATARLGP